ncbi:MAG: FAD-binding oxidoreductase [Acidianus hospitalis]
MILNINNLAFSLLKVTIIGSGIAGSSLYYMFKKAGHNVKVIDPRVRRIFPSLIHSLLLVDKDVYLSKLALDFYNEFNIETKEFPSFTIGKIDEKLIKLWEEYGVKIEEKIIFNSKGIYAVGGDRLVYIKRMIDGVPIIKEKASVIKKGNSAIAKVNDKYLESDIIILAAGPWNSQIFSVPTKSYYCWASLTLTQDSKLDRMFVYDYELNFYSRPFLGLGIRTAIIGDGETIEAKPCQRIKVDPEEVMTRARKRLGKLRVIYTSGEFCEGTPDMRPAYGRLLDNLYFIGGFDGYGAEVGPGVARLLFNFITKGEEDKDYIVDRFNGVKDFKIGKEPHEL